MSELKYTILNSSEKFPDNSYIIDVGATNGHMVKGWKKYCDVPAVYFEPDHTHHGKIPDLTDRDIRLCSVVSEVDGVVPFYYYQTQTHSILPTVSENIEKYIDGFTGKPAIKEKWSVNRVEWNPSIRLDTLCKQVSIQRIPFLKIDAQGADLRVIKSLGDHLHKVDDLLCEVQMMDFELYKGCSKYDELVDYMAAYGFGIISKEEQCGGQELNIRFRKNAEGYGKIYVGPSDTNDRTIKFDTSKLENKHIRVKPTHFDDEFLIMVYEDHITVKRVDQNSGWGMYLDLEYYDK